MKLPATVYAISGAASFATLFLNVHKHGWQWGSVTIGVPDDADDLAGGAARAPNSPLGDSLSNRGRNGADACRSEIPVLNPQVFQLRFESRG